MNELANLTGPARLALLVDDQTFGMALPIDDGRWST
jgi:hypothetical protein